MRADARENYEQLLAAAREVVMEQGANASLRDVARRAGVGLGTLYRHFPSREALLEALLHQSLEEVTARAAALEAASSAREALVAWLHEAVAFTRNYHGVTALLTAALDDPDSALHAACTTVRAAGTRLLTRAQRAGVARPDVDGTELFALIAALGWLGDQAALAPRADRLFHLIVGAILTGPADSTVKPGSKSAHPAGKPASKPPGHPAGKARRRSR